ncbi:GNAT family N-acetyltransferase [Curtobacterium ammoniigenes]|uniref:GNAT family N-acetyltransferase n=1 Tax=Curtobacterium ammoniigenes TaxID=395387 RepID=UPI0008323465|nr:GNAT family N-acetyltransferase [Curtobacterium ammoniigenes]
MVEGIRVAEQRDLEALEAVENKADQLFIELFQPPLWGAAQSGAERAAEPGFVLVADDSSGTIVGFVHVLEVDGIAHLEQLSVVPEHGRRGYGRTLVEAAKAEGRRRGHDRMTLRTYANVAWNAPFYRRAGFTEEEPATPFHRRLVEVEHELGLDQYGQRIQMVASLQ